MALNLPAASEDRRFVTALARGLQLLQCFRHGERWLSHNQITARTGLPKATVSRLAFTLVAMGFLQHDAARGAYALGSGGLSVGFRALAGIDVAALARPVLEELASFSQAAVSLGVRHQNSMVYIAHARGHGRLTLSLDVGARIPLASTAMGRAWLCALPDSRRDAVEGELCNSLGDAWPGTRARLDDAFAQYRDAGFVTSEGEWEPEISATGVPIASPHGGEPYALTIGGPSSALTHDRLLRQLGPRLAEAGREIESALRLDGASMPPSSARPAALVSNQRA